MATKYVSETKAGKSISAYVVLNKRGELVATVSAHHSDGGTCLVNIRQEQAAAEKSAKAAGVSVDDMYFQRDTASGFGYDRFAAAMRGLWIDGHKMADHCGTSEKTKRLLAAYIKAAPFASAEDEKKWYEKARKVGAEFANWNSGAGRYGSLYVRAGLGALESMGYQVINVV